MIRHFVVWILRWLLRESLPDLLEEVRSKLMAEKRQKAEKRVREELRKAKKYRRIFQYADGTQRIMEGDCDSIQQFTDAWAQALHTAPLMRVRDETEVS